MSGLLYMQYWRCNYCVIIILSGLSAAVTIFDMEEIVAGDLVTVELDVEVFRLIHEAAGRWNDGMTVVILSLAIQYVYMTVYTYMLLVFSIASMWYTAR